jgi:hypothetical protein
MQPKPSPTVLPSFSRAGWSPVRAVPIPSIVDPSHPAAEVLASFSGLTVLPTVPGTEAPTMDIRFTNSLDYDPGAAGWEKFLSTQLVVIAEVDQERGVLLVSSDGRYFVLDYCGGFGFAGANFRDAMDLLLLGKRLKPLLRPTESGTRAYGDELPRGDPRIYEYEARAHLGPSAA